MTDGLRAGEGITYAADMDAVVINLAVGALSNPASTTEAAAYAFDKGTLLVGAAGDENATTTLPAVLDNVVYVHSIRYNTADRNRDVKSYMNTWNCNNYGSDGHGRALWGLRDGLVRRHHGCHRADSFGRPQHGYRAQRRRGVPA